MISAWITWTLILLLSVVYMIFSESLFSFILFLIIFIIPIIAAFINRASPKLDFKAEFTDHCEKGETVKGKVIVSNQRHMIYRCVKINIKIENLLTGESACEQVLSTLYAFGNSEFSVKYKSEYCGTIEVSCENARVYDFFGLTYRKLKIAESRSSTVLPDVFPIDIKLNAALGVNGEVQTYADRIGSDLSEVYDFREYVQGDSPKQIHWKLSQKHNELIVKQGSIPTEHQVLMIFANSALMPLECSVAAEAFISISQSLCEAHIFHELMWFYGKTAYRYEIECEEDLAAVIPKLLSAGAIGQTELLEDEEILDFQHIVCVTADSSMAEKAAKYCSKVFLAGSESCSGVTSFAPDRAEEELCEIEI